MIVGSIDAQRLTLLKKIRQAKAIGPEIRKLQILALQGQMRGLRARVVDAVELADTLHKVRDSRFTFRQKELI